MKQAVDLPVKGIEYAKRRLSDLRNERQKLEPTWHDLARMVAPHLGRFAEDDRNRPSDIADILNNTATLAAQVLPRGLMAGASSPARQFFVFQTNDPDLNRFWRARQWLDMATRKVMHILRASKTFPMLSHCYEEMAVFGPAASVMVQDDKQVIRHYPANVGEFFLDASETGEINTFAREFQLTVAQCVERYGWEACSERVQRSWNRKRFSERVTIVHLIEPRKQYDSLRADARNMPFSSCHYELSGSGGAVLRESGYRRFPVLAPSWHRKPGDIYGTSPAQMCLGDVRQLQQETYDLQVAIQKQMDPPVQKPSDLENIDVETQPGGQTVYDAMTPHGGIRSLYELRPDINGQLMLIRDIEQRINRALHVDLFRMLSNMAEQGQKTAYEVAGLLEEKMVQLGPTLEGTHDTLLRPLVEGALGNGIELGQIPPPPLELQGQDISVQFTSMLAQAQQLLEANTLDRFRGTIDQISQSKPEVMDRIDADALADKYQVLLGVDPTLLVSTEQAQKVRKARNDAAAAQQQVEAMAQQAKAVRDLSSSPSGPGNVLSDAIGQFSGYESPTALEVAQ